MPDARPGSAGRGAVRVAGAQDVLCLADVGADSEEIGALIELLHELPASAGGAEDGPATGPPATRDREREDHCFASRARERAAEHLGDRLRRVARVAEVKLVR